jgi:hypothetical protein
VTLVEVFQNKEPAVFWEYMGAGPPVSYGSAFKAMRDCVEILKCITFIVFVFLQEPSHKHKLHEALLGDGFLELPQVFELTYCFISAC